MPPAHEPLDRKYRVRRIRHRLPFCRGADQAFAVLRERHHRRRGAAAFRIRENGRLAAFHDRNTRVGRSQVDSYHLRHRTSTSNTSRQTADRDRRPPSHGSNSLFAKDLTARETHHACQTPRFKPSGPSGSTKPFISMTKGWLRQIGRREDSPSPAEKRSVMKRRDFSFKRPGTGARTVLCEPSNPLIRQGLCQS